MQISRVEINSDWKFRRQGEDEWLPAKVPGCIHTDLFDNDRIDDPFFRNNEKNIQWIDKINWEYRTTFINDPETLKKKNHRLVFEGLDTYADVYLNGEKILGANNMFRSWSINVNGLLRKSNELHIVFRSPVEEDVPKFDALGYQLPAINDQSDVGDLGDKKISIFARKAPYHYGWDWGPRFVTMGIWRSVHLLGWNDTIIESVHYRQHEVNDQYARISANIEITSGCRQTINLKISDKNEGVILAKQAVPLLKGNQVITVPIEIKNPELWWCNGLGEPYLYLINAEIFQAGKLIDKNEVRVGLRSLKVIREKDEKGRSFYFEINGVPLFAKGANYIPNDNFITRVSDAKYEHIIRSANDTHMNMLRVWGGGIYENDIFYDLCDKYGILVWQDFIFACSMYPGDEAFLSNVRQEIVDNVKRLRNHSSIAIWCGNNENDMIWFWPKPIGWKSQFDEQTADKIWSDYRKVFYEMLPEILDEYDPDRFYWPSSPLAEYDDRASYTNRTGDMHYWGVWHSKESFDKFKVHLARFMSEYGFQSFPELATVKKYTLPEDWDIDSEVMTAHQRSGIGNQRIKMYMEWDYHLPENFLDMLYLSQVLQAEGMKIGMEAHRRSKPYCMGSLYWQINDCWPVASWSSIDYYGRWKALHYFAKKAFAPILISPTLDNDIVRVFLVTDKLETVDGEVVLRLLDFKGNILWECRQKDTVSAYKSKIIYESQLEKLTEGRKSNWIVLSCTYSDNNGLVSENLLYFEPVKNLELLKPCITVDINENSECNNLTLQSKTLAKNVYLSLDDVDGFFSDNYFDLLPNLPKTVKFVSETRKRNLFDKLKVASVYDTYH